jgi:hypothetical protein
VASRWALVLFWVVASCGGVEESTSVTVTPPSRPDLGPLGLLLPDGAELVVTARPAASMAAPASRAIIDAVFGAEERDAFARRVGIEPDELDEVVVGEYEGGFAIVVRGPWTARDLVIATASRMTPVEVSADEPFVRRSGFLGTERRDITAIDDDVVLFTAGLPDVTAAVLARVRRGHFPEGRSAALSTEDLAPLYERHQDAPLALYVPTPLRLPPGLGTSLLLARQRALVAVATPAGVDHLAVGVHLVGEFPPGARENFTNLVSSIANQDLGRALGMRDGLESLSVEVDENAAILGLEVPSQTLSLGLRTLFGGEIAELLEAPVRSP